MISKRRAPFFCLTLLLFSNLAHASTGIEVIRSRVNDTECNADFDRFAACLEGLKALFELRSGLTLAPNNYDWSEYAKIDRVRATTVERIGPLKLARLDLEPMTGEITEARLTATKEHGTRVEAASARLFARKKSDIPFRDLLERNLKDLSETEQESLAAYALTAYEIRILKDSHAKVESAAATAGQIRAGETAKEIQGIGISYAAEADGLRIQFTIEGAAAEKAGLRRGDFIVRVDGKSIGDAGGIEAFGSLIPGAPDTNVSLTLLRGSERITLSVPRVKYVVNLIDSRVVGKVGVVRLRTFTDGGACDGVRKAILSLRTQGATSFVLDLRDNGGGDAAQAECIAGLFLPTNRVFYRRKDLGAGTGLGDEMPKNPEPVFQSDPEDSHASLFGRAFSAGTDSPSLAQAPAAPALPSPYPLSEKLTIVLNENSASASEMLASGLRDYARALLVGNRSFGKGCGQHPSPFEGETLKLYSTVFYFVRPLGPSVQRIGITPDLLVYADGIDSPQFREPERFLLSPPALSIDADKKPPAWPNLKAIEECIADLSKKDGLPSYEKSDRPMATAIRASACQDFRSR